MQIGAKPWGTNKRSGGPCFSLLSLLIGAGRHDDHYLLARSLFAVRCFFSFGLQPTFGLIFGMDVILACCPKFTSASPHGIHSMVVTPW